MRDLEPSFAPPICSQTTSFSTLFRRRFPFFSFVQAIRSRRTWDWFTCSSAYNPLPHVILADTPSNSMTMAASRYKDKDAGVLLSFGGQWVSWSHTAVAYRA